LQIFKSNGSPALDVLGGTVPSVTSDSNGIYAFSALADGDYYVRVTPPSGYIPTSNQVADPDNDVDTDSNIDLSRSPPSGSFESGIFTFTGNTEPTLETGAGGTQDDVDDNNGNMTVDFGFYVIPDDFGDYSGFADASSMASTTIKLGTAVTDAETVATKNPTATGDDITGTDDEDGVSFGAFVTAHALARLEGVRDVAKAVLVGTAASRFEVPPVPLAWHSRTLVIHGESDDTVPLSSVMDWARPQVLPVMVIPGGGHFFHGQLPLLKSLVVRHLSAPSE